MLFFLSVLGVPPWHVLLSLRMCREEASRWRGKLCLGICGAVIAYAGAKLLTPYPKFCLVSSSAFIQSNRHSANLRSSIQLLHSPVSTQCSNSNLSKSVLLQRRTLHPTALSPVNTVSTDKQVLTLGSTLKM